MAVENQKKRTIGKTLRMSMNNTYISVSQDCLVNKVNRVNSIQKERQQELDFKWFLDRALALRKERTNE